MHLPLKVEFLDDVMGYVNDNGKKFTTIQISLKKNSSLLVYACNRDNFELVKVMVSHGCHFYTSHNLRILHKVRSVYDNRSLFKMFFPHI